jgi:5'-3' exonuclease
MIGLFELDEAQEPQGDNLLAVDLLNVCFRYKRRNSHDFAADLMRTIMSLAKSYNCQHIVLISDYKYSKYRRALYPEYKQNRKARYEKQTDEEKEQAAKFFEAYEEAVDKVKEMFPTLRLEHVEADDVAGYIVKYHSDKFDHIWLISSDSDWDLLLSEKVSRFSLVTRKEYNLGNFYEEHQCDDPEQYLSQKVLAGDPKDGISGIPGLGPGRSYRFIREYGNAMDLYLQLPIPGSLMTIKNINEVGPEVIMRNYELLDLLTHCDDAILAAGHSLHELDEFICQKLTN